MNIASARLTVLFEDPFWICIYERTCDGQYEVCKITFGTEPKGYEVHTFYLENYDRFTFSPALSAETPAPQREAEAQRQFEIRQEKRREKHRGH